MNDSFTPSYTASSGAMVAYRRVKLGSDGKIAYAGPADVAIGALLADIDSTIPARDTAGVLRPAVGSCYAVYDGAQTLAVGDEIEAAANGKITKRVAGRRIGIALETASADGDTIRVVYEGESGPTTVEIGYVAGTGGAVTQITSSSTGVTLNKLCGQISTVSLTTAAGAEEVFTVTNSKVAATDVIPICIGTYAGAGIPIVATKNVRDGQFDVVITNLHASAALNALLLLNFAVVKAVAA
jgi:hypothetical protein